MARGVDPRPQAGVLSYTRRHNKVRVGAGRPCMILGMGTNDGSDGQSTEGVTRRPDQQAGVSWLLRRQSGAGRTGGRL